MILLLHELQDFTRDLIKDFVDSSAVQYFANESVVSDVGLQCDEIEAALTSRGVSVQVDMPMRGKRVESAPGVSLVMVTIPVVLQVNQKANASASGAGIDALLAMGNIHDAILAYVDQSGGVNDDADRFEAEDDCFFLSTEDSGTVTIVSFFKKLCSISAG